MRPFLILVHGLVWIGSTAVAASAAVELSPLASPPVWSSLDAYQKTITRAHFVRLINTIYSLDGAFWKYAQIDDQHVQVYSDRAHTEPAYTLQFTSDESVEPAATYKTHASSSDPTQPLKGLRIALDPGHIGGDWAKLEERWFQLGNDPPVEEAELNLLTCQILGQLLQADGAEIVWAKEGLQPVTLERPETLQDAAIKWLAHDKVFSPSDKQIQRRAALLFYRVSEINARAEKINQLHPDLTICVHYNADDWGNPAHPTLVGNSRLVIFINGDYEAAELVYDDQKYCLLRKLLERDARSEEKGCELVGQQMLDIFHYPPETYAAYFARRVTDVSSVYARNLIANRLYHGPVIYCEGPYMNARDAYPRIIAGDYLGRKTVAGQSVQSVYRDYARAVEKGVRAYFGVE